MTFFELAQNRYSERLFDSRHVEQEKIDKILEAGRLSPTAANFQPQHIYVIQSEEALKYEEIQHSAGDNEIPGAVN